MSDVLKERMAATRGAREGNTRMHGAERPEKKRRGNTITMTPDSESESESESKSESESESERPKKKRRSNTITISPDSESESKSESESESDTDDQSDTKETNSSGISKSKRDSDGSEAKPKAKKAKHVKEIKHKLSKKAMKSEESNEPIRNRGTAITFLESICTSYFSVFDYNNPIQVYPKITKTCTIVEHDVLSRTTTDAGWLSPLLTSYCITDPLQNGGMTNVVVVGICKNNGKFCIREAYGRVDSVKQPTFFKSLQETGNFVDSSEFVYRSQKPSGYCLYNASYNARERLKEYAELNQEKKDKVFFVCLYYKDQNHYDVFDCVDQESTFSDVDKGVWPEYVNITDAAKISTFADPLLVASHYDNQTNELKKPTLTFSYHECDKADKDDVSGLIATPSCETKYVAYDIYLSDPSTVKAYKYFKTEKTIDKKLEYHEKKQLLADARDQYFDEKKTTYKALFAFDKFPKGKKFTKERLVEYIQNLHLEFETDDHGTQLSPKAFGFCYLNTIKIAKNTVVLNEFKNQKDLLLELHEQFKSTESTEPLCKFTFDPSKDSNPKNFLVKQTKYLANTSITSLKEDPLFYEWLPLFESTTDALKRNEEAVKNAVVKDYQEFQPSTRVNNVRTQSIAPLVKINNENVDTMSKELVPPLKPTTVEQIKEYQKVHFNSSAILTDTSMVYKMNWDIPKKEFRVHLQCRTPTNVFENKDGTFGLFAVYLTSYTADNLISSLPTCINTDKMYVTWDYETQGVEPPKRKRKPAAAYDDRGIVRGIVPKRKFIFLCIIGGHHNELETKWAREMFKKVAEKVKKKAGDQDVRFEIVQKYKTLKKRLSDTTEESKITACLVWREFGFGKEETWVDDNQEEPVIDLLTNAPCDIFPRPSCITFYNNKFERDVALNLGPTWSFMVDLSNSGGSDNVAKKEKGNYTKKKMIKFDWLQSARRFANASFPKEAGKTATYIIKPINGFGGHGFEKFTGTKDKIGTECENAIEKFIETNESGVDGFIVQLYQPFNELRGYCAKNDNGKYELVHTVFTESIDVLNEQDGKVNYNHLGNDIKLPQSYKDKVKETLRLCEKGGVLSFDTPAVRVDVAIGEHILNPATNALDTDVLYVNEVESISMCNFLSTEEEISGEKLAKFTDQLVKNFANYVDKRIKGRWIGSGNRRRYKLFIEPTQEEKDAKMSEQMIKGRLETLRERIEAENEARRKMRKFESDESVKELIAAAANKAAALIDRGLYKSK
jgi:hypothetical protein